MTYTWTTAEGDVFALPAPSVDVGVADDTVGTVFDKARRDLGWTTAQLARQAGITASTVGRILNGSRPPSAEQARRLSAALGVDVVAGA